uniref:AP-2 complex subunit alpha n=1 Tax=Theileria parva TaxID=5875 RepID=Q4N0J0_THEPA|eukprot:XP_763164.1 hypothetical protein [Theileria parva strain Muguga]
MKGQYVRGLVKFITDIRNLKTDEDKETRIKEEVAKIRVSFSSPRLTDYDKKKHLLKLLYVQMLGYDIDLGYLESVQLMASPKLADKATGYMGCEILLREYEEVMRLCINTTLEDMNNPCEHVCSLALIFLANTHSLEINERLSGEVVRLSMNSSSDNDYLRKKLYMCLLRTYKLNPQLYNINEWYSMVYQILESESTVSCLLPICNLLHPILSQKPKNWELSVDRLASFLSELSKDEVPVEHCYFTISAPWLTVKILSIFASVEPHPNYDFLPMLSNSLKTLLDKTSNLVLTRLGNKHSNRAKKLMNLSIYMTKTGILRETIRAVVNWFPYLSNISAQFVCNCIRHLYTSVMSQIRLVALEIIEDVIKIKETYEYIKNDAEYILHFLNDSDPTIKKRSCLILCGLCDVTNWELIVPELISTLRYSEISIQEYMVPLICKTIDKHLPKNTLYIDLIFKIITHAPLVSNISISTLLLTTLYKENSVKFQEKFVDKCLYYLQDETEITEGLLRFELKRSFYLLFIYSHIIYVFRICAHVLGDYGHLSTEVGMKDQLKLFEKYFVIASPECKCVIVTTLGKFASRDNSLVDKVGDFLETQVNSTDVNLQIRSCELLKMLRTNVSLFNRVMTIISDKKPSSRLKHSDRSPTKESYRESSREVYRNSHRVSDGSSLKDSFDKPVPRDSFDRNLSRDSFDRNVSRDSFDRTSQRVSSERTSLKESARSDNLASARDRDVRRTSAREGSSGLFSNESCVLLLNEYFTVELEQAYRNQHSKLLVRLKNVSNEDLYVHKCALKSPPELHGQEHNQLRDVKLKPGQVANHKLSFMLMDYALELPNYFLDLGLESKIEPLNHTLNLPVCVHKFMKPLELDPPSFTKLWNTLTQTQPFMFKFKNNISVLANSLTALNFDVVKTGDNVYVSASGLVSTESSEFFCLGMFTADR